MDWKKLKLNSASIRIINLVIFILGIIIGFIYTNESILEITLNSMDFEYQNQVGINFILYLGSFITRFPCLAFVLNPTSKIDFIISLMS